MPGPGAIGLILNGKIVVTASPTKIALNQIVPVHQQFLTKLPVNAVGFELYENGKFAISAKSNSVFLKQIVGPKDQVTVVAVGKDGTKSAPSRVKLSNDPISLANINFNTDTRILISGDMSTPRVAKPHGSRFRTTVLKPSMITWQTN